MARHKAPAAEIRRALAEGMKAGYGLGFDGAVDLAAAITEEWGEGASLVAELRKMRDAIVSKQQAKIDKQAGEG